MSTASLALDRIDIRLARDDKNYIQAAAAYEGMTVAAFLRKAGLDLARSVMDKKERIEISRTDALRILDAMNRPFEPNAALREAMEIAERIERNSTERRDD